MTNLWKKSYSERESEWEIEEKHAYPQSLSSPFAITHKPVSLVRLHFKNPRSAIAVPLRVKDPSQSLRLSCASILSHPLFILCLCLSFTFWLSSYSLFPVSHSHSLHSPSAFLSQFLTFSPLFWTCSPHLMVGDSKTLHPIQVKMFVVCKNILFSPVFSPFRAASFVHIWPFCKLHIHFCIKVDGFPVEICETGVMESKGLACTPGKKKKTFYTYYERNFCARIWYGGVLLNC